MKLFFFLVSLVLLFPFQTPISLSPDSSVIRQPFPSSLPPDAICLPWWQAPP